MVTAVASALIAVSALVHSASTAPPGAAAPRAVVRPAAQHDGEGTEVPLGPVRTPPTSTGPVAAAVPQAPYGLEVSPLSTEENGEVVLRLRVTAR
jgi:hypothetical protein